MSVGACVLPVLLTCAADNRPRRTTTPSRGLETFDWPRTFPWCIYILLWVRVYIRGDDQSELHAAPVQERQPEHRELQQTKIENHAVDEY